MLDAARGPAGAARLRPDVGLGAQRGVGAQGAQRVGARALRGGLRRGGREREDKRDQQADGGGAAASHAAAAPAARSGFVFRAARSAVSKLRSTWTRAMRRR